MNDLTYINCSVCKEPMPELRLTKFGFSYCVNCSTTTPKRGMPIMRGDVDKDDNWVDIEFID